MGQFGISQPVLRREDDKLLRGTGCFIDDLTPDGLIHGHVLRSPHGHARIVALDVSQARTAPGVLAVYTAADLAAAGIGAIQPVALPSPREGNEFQSREQPILAADTVQYVGDSVAFVVAETPAQAQDAAEAIIVEYEPLAAKYRVPIVVTGFEPLDILQGIYMCVNQLETGRAQVENQYARTVQQDGNRRAIDLIDEIFSVIPRKWRGIDEIPQSGLGLCAKYADFDAECRFDVCVGPVEEASECISGQVLQGLRKPNECPAFGTSCHPGHPLGATMVSSEGACAAYHRYRPQREYS